MIDRATGHATEASATTPDEVARSFTGDPGRPDVWVFDRTSAEFAELGRRGPVSPEDLEKAARLRGPGLGEDLLCRRAAVRRVLAAYLGRDADSIRIVTLPGGKPAFVPQAGDRRVLSYSSAKSAELFCLAIGTASSLGVDVERERPVSRALPIAMRWFSRDEAVYLRGLPEDRFPVEFMRIWTAKEALAKRHSAGLRLMTGGEQRDLDVNWEAATGTLVRFAPRAAFVGALASTSAIEEVRIVKEAARAL